MAVRIILALLGLFLAGYAISDDPFYGGAPGFGGTQAFIALLGAALLVVAAIGSPARRTNTLLLSGTFLLMLALTEWVTDKVLGPVLRPPYDYDEKLLFKLRPGAKCVAPQLPENGGGAVPYEINSEGFRGPELDPKHEKPRILVYGDSFIHATYTPEDETFVRQLGRQLEPKLGPVEMVNAGVSSYGPDQEGLRMETELAKYKPQLVVVAVFAGNDYGDLMRNKLYRVDEGDTLEPSPHQVDASIRDMLVLNSKNSAVMRGLKNIRTLVMAKAAGVKPEVKTDAAAKKKQIDSWVEMAKLEYDEHVIKKDPIVRNTHIDYYSVDLSVDPASDAGRYKAKLMKLVLGHLVDLTKAANVPLVFLFIPHPMDVAEHYDYAEIDRARFPSYDPKNLIQPLLEFSSERSVPSVDLFEVYRAHGDPLSLYLKGGDDHWNSVGQRIAAEAVAAKIIELGPLAKP